MSLFRTLFLVTMLIIFSGMIYAQSNLYDLYVSSSGNNSVKVYNGQTGEYIDDFVKPGAGGLANTQEVVFGPGGYLYVTGFGNAMIKKYDGQTGEFIENFSKNYSLVQPAKMTFRYEDSLIYVSQWGGTRKVVRFRMSDGELVDEFSSTALSGGCGFAWDPEGNMYVAGWGSSGNNGYVQKFDTAGVYQEHFITSASVNGPVNCWFGDDGKFYVQDWTRGSVERFLTDGTFDTTYISNLVRSEGFDWDENGNLYLCDWQTNQIKQYDAQGTAIGIFASGGGMNTPNGIMFGPKYQAVGIDDSDDIRLGEFRLAQNYPNPFNPSTTIEYELSAAAEITLQIFNNLGQLIQTPYRASQPAGTHKFGWNATDAAGNPVPSGVYFYRLIVDGQPVATRKMLLMK